MGRIVNESGKKFEPDAFDMPLSVQLLAREAAEMISKPSVFADQLKLEQLRASCGVEPSTIRIRFKPPEIR